MLFTLVAVSLSASFGSITPESHPSARLIAQADAPMASTSSFELAELQRQLDVELGKSSPFIAPGVLFGLAGVTAIIGTIFIFVRIGWAALLVIVVAWLAAIVFLSVGIGTVIAAGVVQGHRNKRIKDLREQIAQLQRDEEHRQLLPPPPPPPPGVQNLPSVTPQFVLAYF